MKLLDRYIGRVVAIHCMLVMTVLLTIYFFTAFIGEVGDVGKGSYDLLGAVNYSLMLLPRQAYELFPFAALLGAMLGLGTLANSSELTVIRSAGISVRRILFSVAKMGVVLVVLVAVLGEVVAPPLEKLARLKRAQDTESNFSMNTKEGLWGRDGSTLIHIRRYLSNGLANGVTFYQFSDDGQLKETTFAASAQYSKDAWDMYGIIIDSISEEGVEREYRTSDKRKTSLTPEVINIVAVPPEKLSIWELWDYVQYMKRNDLDSRHYEVSLWVKLVAPLATMGMVLLAVPFVVGSLRTISVGQRIMTGSLLGIGFFIFNATFNRVGIVFDIPPFLSAAIPTLIIYLLWAYMMRRIEAS